MEVKSYPTISIKQAKQIMMTITRKSKNGNITSDHLTTWADT